MVRAVELHPGAVDDSERAFSWYEERSPIAAHAFLIELDHSIKQVMEFPQRWLQYLAGTRRFSFARFPFNLIYQLSAEAVVVLSISHQRRRPGYWVARGAA